MRYLSYPPSEWNRFYDHMKDDLWMLRHAHDFRTLRGEERLEAEAELVTFFSNASLPHDIYRAGDRHTLSRLEWVKYGMSVHPGVIRVIESSEEAAIGPDPLSETRDLPLGFLPLGFMGGFTTVVPLTEAAFDEMVFTSMAGSDLMPHHLAPPDAIQNGMSHLLYIGGVVAWTSLINPGSVGGTNAVIKGLFHHVGRFVPAIGIQDDTLSMPRGLQFPKFVCIARGTGIADLLVNHAGFVPCGQDRLNFPKYHLDVGHASHPGVAKKRRGNIRVKERHEKIRWLVGNLRRIIRSNTDKNL